MNKLIIPENEQARLKALKNYNILDTLPEEEFDRLTQMASLICGTPISLITLLDEERQWFKSIVGLEGSETPRKDSFCQHTIMQDSLMEVKDTWLDQRFRDNPLVTGLPEIRYYAGYPLIDPDGHALGALCIVDRKPNELDSNQQKLLSLLANEVVSQIVNRKEKIVLKNYEKLFLESLDLIAVAGQDGYFRKVNPAFQQTLGWAPNDLIKKPFYSFIHPDDVESAMNKVQGLTRGGRVLNFTTRFRTTAGQYKYLQWIATPDVESDNIYAIARDITDLIKIQNELAQVSKFQEKIVNGTSYAIITTDTEGGITTFNRGAENMLGYEAHEMINRQNLADLIDSKELIKEKSELNESLPTPLTNNFEVLTASLKAGKTDTTTRTFLKKDGTNVEVELSLSPLENDRNEVTAHLAFGRDITLRKAALTQLEISERRHRAFFENSQSLMCTHDLNGNFTSINPAGLEMMGYTFGEFSIKSLYDIVVPEYKNEIDDYLQKIRRNGSRKGLMQVMDNKGDVRTWLYNNVLSETADGTQYVIGNAVDLTSRINIEKELLRAKENAEKNARAKDIFLANMSHEIRTPMNAIIGFANLLKDTPMTKEQWEYTNNINTASLNLMGIINDILDFSKIESGHLVIEEISYNLKELVKNVKAVLNQKAIEKNLNLDIFMGDSIPEHVMGDPTRLNQILLNLINNALKFTERGSVKLFVELSETTADGYLLEFSIVDTGIGIPEDKLDTIFERFAQADTDTTRKYGGTGLGLSISKLLIELQKGSISVKSRHNEGSTFSFSLPVKKVVKSQTSRQENKPPLLISDKRLKILLVEDNLLNQRLALKVLENFGFETDLAVNGKVAVDKVSQSAYNIILMDLQMPEMDGYQATETIRQKLKNSTPIVAMTAHSLVGERDKCLAVGMNDYLPKPFAPADLFNKITNLAVAIEEETEQTEAESLIDLTYLKMISGDSPEFEAEMIELFLQQTPAELQRLEQAVADQNHALVREVAHKLKSSYSLVGILEDGLVQLLERQGADKAPIESIKSNFEQLTQITRKATKVLEGMV
jgi:PAS domain S-box-containing protein